MQIVVNGVLINYQDINPKAKNALVILHGWGQGSTHWLSLAKMLTPKTRYIIVDLPGFGQSHFLPGDASVPEYTQFLHDLLNKLKLKKPSILGHSFGGQVGINFAASYPQALSQLILVSPAGIRSKSKKWLLNFVVKNLKFAKKVLPGFLFDYLRNRVASEDYRSASFRQRAILNQIIKQDLTHKLHKISAPTHILWGDVDVTIPYKGKFLAENIKNAKLYVLYGADHNPHLYKQAELAKLINSILENEAD